MGVDPTAARALKTYPFALSIAARAMASRSSALAGFGEDQADEDVAGAHRLVVEENVPPVAPDGMMEIPILRPNAQAHVRV